MTDPVIGVDELVELGASAALADVRWYLGEPDRGREEYERGHIPGAVFVDLERDLSAREGPGRHPLPSRDAFAARIGRLGFADSDMVVAYDDRGGEVAARLWWMLRDMGHTAARVLDGGIAAWQRAGHLIETGWVVRDPATMSIRSGPTRTIDRTHLSERLGAVTLLDARAGERYRGEEEPVDPVAGHIPTATSAPVTGNLDENGRFLGSDILRNRFTALEVSDDTDTVVYCGSGVTACHNALAIVRAGLPEPILYPGSWSDWSTSGEPAAVGPDPGTIQHPVK